MFGDLTVLCLAVRRKDAEMVHILLRAGAKVNGGPTCFKPLNFACHLESLQMVQLVLKAGACPSI
ncbi:unnamed protein product, partial [Sphacelaria rigidula]